MKIVLNHLSPFGLYLLVGPGIAVARQVHIVEGVVNVVKIDRLGFSRLSRRSGIGLPVHQRVNQGRFPYVGLPGKGKLRLRIGRKLAGDAADSLQIYFFYNHFRFLFSLTLRRASIFPVLFFLSGSKQSFP